MIGTKLPPPIAHLLVAGRSTDPACPTAAFSPPSIARVFRTRAGSGDSGRKRGANSQPCGALQGSADGRERTPAPLAFVPLAIYTQAREGPIGVRLFDLINGISGALDLICPEVVGHHRRVGALAAALGSAMGLCAADRSDLLAAGLLHDAGAFSLSCRIDTLEFETRNAEHAETGFRLLRASPMLSRAARIVRRHHTSWADPSGREDPETFLLSNVLNLADRVDVLVRSDRDVLEQV